MPRFIDADALTKVLTEHKDFYAPNLTALVNEAMASGLRIAIREVKNAPTADVVEVVRCEKCKHRRTTPYGSFCLPAYGLKRITDLDSFCSYGERKEK